MKKKIQMFLNDIKKNSSVDAQLIDLFQRFIETGSYTKETNPSHHLCSFFVPFDPKTQVVYMGHHIKADYWIPPGGHVDADETPLDAAIRECGEELNYTVQPSQMIFFDLSIHHIDDPKRTCKTHYDFWYYFISVRMQFQFDTGEFHDAGWLPLEDAIQKTESENVKKTIAKLKLI